MSDVTLAIRLRALGDVVLVTPALRSLAGGCRELHVVTEPRFAPLLEGLPWIARVWGVERSGASTRGTAAALRRLRPRRAVDFFGNPRSALLARASGAAAVWGYDLRGRRHFYTGTVPREKRLAGGRREPAVETHLRLARAAGGAAGDTRTEIAAPPAARSLAERLLAEAGVREPGRTVGLLAAGSWPTKAWPVSHSAVLARELSAAGYEVLLLAGPGEAGVTRRLAGLAPEVRALPPCGVGPLVAVIARLRAVVGTDSGPRHVAAALGVPTFSWFGPTHPDTWNPPGDAHGFWATDLPCRACDLTACPHWNCLPSLSPGDGSALVLAHLERHARDGR
ncbi:MAG: glycosyltransferase family 9 protein [Candidatus Eisenbacteria bacterium]|nr:glycosyltransferase family 9 protein [Candidatus Eisenbacteria bacterium]